MKPNLVQRVRLGVAAAFLLGGLVALFAFLMQAQYERNRVESRRTWEFLKELTETDSMMKDAETGQRGFLLTGQEEYLAPYEQALATLRPAFERLKALAGEENEDTEVLRLTQEMEATAVKRLDALRLVIERARGQGREAAVDIIKEGQGKALMDLVREETSELQRRAGALFEQRRARVDFSSLILRLSTIGAVTLLLLFVAGLARLLLADVRRAERAEAEVRDGESRHRTTLMSTADGLITTDTNGRVTLMNPTAERLTGVPFERARGLVAAEVLAPRHPLTGSTLADPLQGVFPKGSSTSVPVVALVGPPESTRPVEFTCSSVVDADGTVRGSVLAFRDVTERLQQEREREALLASERAARSDAERASRLKDEFVATLSHELRTPLNAILGWTQILRRPGVDQFTTSQGLEIIERNTRVQAALVSDLLDVSRMMSGKLRLEVQSCDLPGIVADAVESVRPTAEAKGVRLSAVLDQQAGPVTGDPARLQQVAWNLLSNAIKFTPKGGKVSVQLSKVESHVEIEVCDTGEGIDPAFLPHVFERFRQADATTTRTHGGLGLGLSIARQLTELHGGRINARSVGKGQGATFTVVLPMIAVQQGRSSDGVVRPPARASEHGQPLDAPDLNGLEVLVVDDEPDARLLLQRVLSERGAKVRCADGVEQAMSFFADHQPDLLISDLGMPVQDGFQMIKRVRALPLDQGGDVPAVALTAFARTSDRTRSLLAGFQAHLTKPVDASELLATISSLARRRNTRSEHGHR